MLMMSETAPARTEDNFLRTFTGRKFWPLNPRVEDIAIEDIAHSLSLVARFTGHTYCHYSVAEHSLYVSSVAVRIAMNDVREWPASMRVPYAREVALWGLMHDASEAYLCDLPSPIKHASCIGDLYRRFEHALMRVIAQRFDLSGEEPACVKQADRILCNTEKRDLMQGATWHEGVLAKTIYPMLSDRAEAEFLRRFHALNNARNLAGK